MCGVPARGEPFDFPAAEFYTVRGVGVGQILFIFLASWKTKINVGHGRTLEGLQFGGSEVDK